MCRILERRGWVKVRVHGAHHVYKKAGVRNHIAVPVHGNAALPTGTQASIMRDAGLTDADL
jgi:predicted RNA binding protein YcfA (HicA-like mRNA interferase family)